MIEAYFVEKTNEMYKRLCEVWSGIGFGKNGINIRTDFLKEYIAEFYEEIIVGEINLRTEIEQHMIQYREKVNELKKILKIEHVEQHFDNLLAEHDYYKEMHNKLQALKEDNKKSLCDLKAKESELCKDLKENMIDLPDESLVGDEDLEVIEEHIRELCEEKQTRWNMVKTLSENVNSLYEENHIQIDEWSSLNQIKDIFNDPSALRKVKIDKHSINKYRRSLKKLYTKREEIINKIDELATKIEKMWNNFNLSSMATPFLVALVTGERTNSDYTLSNYQLLNNEYQRCVSMKRMLFRDYIEEIRERILMLWDEYKYNKVDRIEMQKLIDEENVTEQLYDMHKKYLDDLLKYGKKHETLIKSLNAWITKWENFCNFDTTYSDPNRFRSKGYSALYEQKERHSYEIGLLRLEKKLIESQNEYLSNENEEFEIDGLSLRDFISMRKTEYESQKEEARKQRLINASTPMKDQKSISSPFTKFVTPKSGNKLTPNANFKKLQRHSAIVKNEKTIPKIEKILPNSMKATKRSMQNTKFSNIPTTPLVKKEPSLKTNEINKRSLDFPKISVDHVKSEDINHSRNKEKKNKRISITKLVSNFKRRSSTRSFITPEIVITKVEDDDRQSPESCIEATQCTESTDKYR